LPLTLVIARRAEMAVIPLRLSGHATRRVKEKVQLITGERSWVEIVRQGAAPVVAVLLFAVLLLGLLTDSQRVTFA